MNQPVENTSAVGSQTRSEKRAEEKKKVLAAKQQRLLLILIAASIVFNLVLGYVLYNKLVVSKQHERLVDASQSMADQAATSVEDFIEIRRGKVTTWADNASLSRALSDTKSTAMLSTLERSLQKMHTGILTVRIIPKGKESLDPTHAAPIRYAELDLIRRSTRREQVQAEIAPLDKGWQLQIISPIPSTGQGDALGSLLVTYNNLDFLQALKKLHTGNGKLELQQAFKTTIPLALAIMGEGEALKTPATHSIANSYLSMAFTPNEILVRSSEELPSVWLIILSLTTTGGLALALLLSKLLVRGATKELETGFDLPQGYIDAQKNEQEKSAENKPEQPLKTDDVLDIAIVGADADILGLGTPLMQETVVEEKIITPINVPSEIFRAYDIRGETETLLTTELAEYIGKAVGSETLAQGEASLIIARDGRISSPQLCESLIKGILSTGCHVINIGVVPTPLMHFATHEFTETSSGIMVTASHNNATQNGFKMVINGVTLSDGAITGIHTRISRQEFTSGDGREQTREIIPAYIDRIFSDVALAGDITIVVDAANAVAGNVAPALFEELGCNVIPLYCELDGNFPNHAPDPTKIENLQDLIAKVKETQADLGVALDGDGDRLMIVTPSGEIIWPDRLLMLFAKDILSRNPGADILFDVKCSSQLNQLISSYGGRPIMWKTGHAHMKQKMQETGALIGGEYSGHIFIKERWYGFDDGLYTTARLLEIITLRDQPIDEVFASLPMLPCTPEIRVAMDDSKKFEFIKALINTGSFDDGKTITIDGLRVDFGEGWGLVRASNTAAELTLRFEAESPELLEKIQQLFKREMLKIDASLQLDGF